jgi:hypothetical protein
LENPTEQLANNADKANTSITAKLTHKIDMDQGRIREIPYAHLSQKNPDPYKVTFVTTLFSPSTPTHPDDNLFCEATHSRAKAESSSI